MLVSLVHNVCSNLNSNINTSPRIHPHMNLNKCERELFIRHSVYMMSTFDIRFIINIIRYKLFYRRYICLDFDSTCIVCVCGLHSGTSHRKTRNRSIHSDWTKLPDPTVCYYFGLWPCYPQFEGITPNSPEKQTGLAFHSRWRVLLSRHIVISNITPVWIAVFLSIRVLNYCFYYWQCMAQICEIMLKYNSVTRVVILNVGLFVSNSCNFVCKYEHRTCSSSIPLI